MPQKYYIRWGGNNFGDNLNNIIFESLGVKNCLYYRKDLQIPDEPTYLGLGTILGKRLYKPVKILGSGSGQEGLKCNHDYIFVRGKLTCKFLGIDEKFGKGDTAYFLKNWIQEKAAIVKKYEIGVIPHHKTIIQNDNLHIISPTLPVDEFVKKASQCKILLCEAMHGAICADILRIPFAPIEISNPLYYFKWNDWASVLDLKLEFGNLTNYKLHLSKESIFQEVCLDVKSAISSEFYE